jgi:hypothetical protein
MMNNIEKVEQTFACLKEIEKRDGFTIDSEGNEVVRDTGYAVSIYEAPLHIITLEMATNDGYVGFWRDPESGKEYTDYVQIVDDIDVARHLGRTHNQIAFFDFSTKEAVYV